MGKIILVTNHKGGVGKTTTAAAVGAALSAAGKKTLLIDLDAQGNLTGIFMQGEQKKSIYNALKGEIGLPVKQVRENLYLVPSALEMAGIELEINGTMSREFILRELLQPVRDEYEYIIIDTPPSIGLVTINAMAAADYVIIPLVAEALPVKGLKMLTDVLGVVKKRLNPAIELGGVVITRWENSNLSRMVEAQIRQTFGEKVFDTKIRKNVTIAEAPLAGTDVLSYAPRSHGAQDYAALAQEMESRLGCRRN